MQTLIDEGKRWDAMDVGRSGAIAIEDVAIENVSEWAGTAEKFGEQVYDELFNADHQIREIYLCAAAELYDVSLLQNDTTGIMIALCRLAANQMFLRRAFDKYGQDA